MASASPAPTGTYTYVASLLKELTHLDEVEVIILYPGNSFPDIGLKRDKIEVITFASKPSAAWHYRDIPKFLSKRKDIEVYHDPNTLCRWGSLPQRKVLTVHDLSCIVNKKWCSYSTRAKYKKYLRKGLEGADVIITPSQFTGSEIERIFPTLDLDVRVVPHGVDERLLDIVPKALGSLTHIGAFTPRKGIKDAIDFFRMMSKRGESKFMLAGNTTEHKASSVVRKVKASSIADKTEIITNFGDAKQVYKNTKCLVSFSRYEGFGLPVLDACAAGIPVIANDIPSYREILPPGYPGLIPGGDLDSAAKVFPDLIEDIPVKGLRERAREFTWRRCAARTTKIYLGSE